MSPTENFERLLSSGKFSFLGMDVVFDYPWLKNAPAEMHEATDRLLEVIAENLAEVLERAEVEFRDFYADDEDKLDHASEPMLLFDEDDLEAWAIVVLQDDDDDYGTHIEFRLLEFSGIWSGD